MNTIPEIMSDFGRLFNIKGSRGRMQGELEKEQLRAETEQLARQHQLAGEAMKYFSANPNQIAEILAARKGEAEIGGTQARTTQTQQQTQQSGELFPGVLEGQQQGLDRQALDMARNTWGFGNEVADRREGRNAVQTFGPKVDSRVQTPADMNAAIATGSFERQGNALTGEAKDRNITSMGRVLENLPYGSPERQKLTDKILQELGISSGAVPGGVDPHAAALDEALAKQKGGGAQQGYTDLIRGPWFPGQGFLTGKPKGSNAPTNSPTVQPTQQPTQSRGFSDAIKSLNFTTKLNQPRLMVTEGRPDNEMITMIMQALAENPATNYQGPERDKLMEVLRQYYEGNLPTSAPSRRSAPDTSYSTFGGL